MYIETIFISKSISFILTVAIYMLTSMMISEFYKDWYYYVIYIMILSLNRMCIYMRIYADRNHKS